MKPCCFSLWQWNGNSPLAANTNQPGFAWCHRHGAKRMVHLPQKVITSGIAWNTSSRKWGPTSVSQPQKNIRWLYFCKRQPAFGRATEQITV
ncbi:hypothetical protein ACMSEA_19165 [Bacteroides thetaiotaomicron]|uniref:hypothetical protein n=1 Tax=Bacteroides thetaiotaomicron TaxID=818 RepID=UPI0039C04A38